jgi:hypothetical protein
MTCSLRAVAPGRNCACGLVIVAAVSLMTMGASGKTEVPMKEVPIPAFQYSLNSWRLDCGATPSAEVKKYPQFKSAKPLYGEFFPKASDRQAAPGRGYFFAIDESKGTGSGYDAFYLDANHDLDLTDDPPSRRGKVPSAESLLQEASFDAITIPGAREDGGDLKIEPRGRVAPVGWLSFSLAPAVVRQGRAQIGDRTYTVILAPTECASSRYDLASTYALIVLPYTGLKGMMQPGASEESYAGPLSTMYLINGVWLNLSATQKGDVLTVSPYEGDTGVIRVSHNGETRGNRIHDGTFRSRSGITIQNHGGFFAPQPDPRPLRLPVGDYAPAFLGIEIGQYEISTRRRCAPDKQDEYGDSDYYVKISKDKAYVLDIGSTAEIVFSRPKAGPAPKPGDSVYAGWELVTPTLMISSIMHRTSWSIHPAMTIRDSSGNVVSQGPFQFANYWAIPKSFVPKNGRETLKLTVEWDTKELFGVVKGEREIIVESTDTAGAK